MNHKSPVFNSSPDAICVVTQGNFFVILTPSYISNF